MTEEGPVQAAASGEFHATQSPRGDLGKAAPAAKPLKGRAAEKKRKLANERRPKSARQLKRRRTVHYATHYSGIKTPLRDNWAFHDFLTLSPQHKNLVKQVLLPRLLEGERRERQRCPAWAETALQEVCAVLANAMKAHELAPSRRVYYSRDNNTYSDDKKELYYPVFMGTKSLGRVLDSMIAGGWLDGQKTPQKKYLPKLQKKRRKGRRSTFQATKKLLKALSDLGISHKDAVESDDAPLLILKNKKKERISYNRHEKRRMRETVHEINRFLSKQNVWWPQLSVMDLRRDAETLRDREEDEVFDPSRKRLYRVFNNEDWHQNGRFYGGGWQPLSEEQRSRIRINGEPTVELDYEGFLVRAAYHSKGLPLKGDPYLVPTIEEIARKNGDQWIDIRPDVKRVTQAIIYAKPNQKLEFSKKLPLPAYLELGTVLALIEDHHRPIKDTFKGAGMFLTYKEACICEQVLTAGVQAGIPILSIHDSYVVAGRHQEWLRDQMMECYRKEFDGFEPVVTPELEAAATPSPAFSLVASPDLNPAIYKNRKSDQSALLEEEVAGPDPAEEAFLAGEWEAALAAERQLEGHPKYAAFVGACPPAGSSLVLVAALAGNDGAENGVVRPSAGDQPAPSAALLSKEKDVQAVVVEAWEMEEFGAQDRRIRGLPEFEAILKASSKTS